MGFADPPVSPCVFLAQVGGAAYADVTFRHQPRATTKSLPGFEEHMTMKPNVEPPPPIQSDALDPVAALLQGALERRIEEETALHLCEVESLRGLLAEFEGRVRAEVRYRTLGAMLTAVGEKMPAFTDPSPDVEVKLKSSLRALLAQLGEPTPFVEPPRPDEVVEVVEPEVLTSLVVQVTPRVIVEAPTEVLALDNLRRALADRPVALVGGIAVNEKVDLIHRKFDLPVEWIEIDSGAPRSTENALRRIRKRSVGAVIILEAFLPHKAANPVVEACNASRIPWAYGARAGVGTISTALQELDRKTGQGSFFRPS